MMRICYGWVGWLGLALVILAQPVLASSEGQAPTGWDKYVEPVQHGGGAGVAAFPAVVVGGELVEILDPTGFELHMTPADDPGEEKVVPAGRPFLPPKGRWRLWLQGESSMTPYSYIVTFASRRKEGWVSSLELGLAPAGRVHVTSAFEHDHELRLLYTGSRPANHQFEHSRRRPISEAREGVLMPADSVLAAVWDPGEERYLALSRPFQVPARAMIEAPLEVPPEGVAQLFAYVADPGAVEPAPHADVDLVVLREGDEHRPDFTFATAWGLYAVWYELPPGPAVLAGGNEELYLARQNLELAGGQVAGFEGRLARRPSLDVNLVLPAAVREKPLSLEVRKLPEGELLAEEELRRDAGRHRFENLVHGLVEVTLVTHLGPFREQVDLTGPEEAFLSLEPELIEVYGTVRHGGEPHPAEVVFLTGATDEVRASAGEDGGYEAVSLEPLRFVSVHLAEVDHEPWSDFLMPALDESRELDFDIPDADVRVRVVDATTGAGIAGARVAVRSVYRLPAERETEGPETERRERVFAKSYEVDEEGVVRLPPPREGHIELSAHAEGFRPQAEDLVVQIEDASRDRDLELSLEPFGERVPVRLTLPDGSPAAGAEVVRVESLSSTRVLFADQADGEGIVRVPVEPAEGLLVLKPAQPGAAFGIVVWARWKDEAEVEWRFPPAAELPLSVRTWGPAGEEPAPRAELALWVGGRKLSGAPLQLVAGVRQRSDANGFWSAAGLPREGVRVLAWSRNAREEAAAGALDTLAKEVPYPWPVQVDVRVVR